MAKKKAAAKKAGKKAVKPTKEASEPTAISKPVGKVGNLVRRT